MLRRLFKRTPRTPSPSVPVPPGLPEGVVVWAIGDIHGRLDLLEKLLDAAAQTDDPSSGLRVVMVFLGDYVDRGANSQGVIDRLCALQDEGRFETRFLKGNHEDKMLEFLDDPSVGPAWCEYGGADALKSFGLKVPAMRHRVEAWASLSADLSHRLSPRQLRFLKELETSVSIGGYFFAHAGARPGVPLDEQSDHDLMWIRNSFLNDPEPFDRVVVHGHTPTVAPYADHRRVGVDTKAYASGVLTAVRLQAEDLLFVQAVEGPAGAREIRTLPR